MVSASSGERKQPCLRNHALISNYRAVGAAAEECGVSIHAILQNPIVDANDLSFVVTTEPAPLSRVKAFAAAIERMSFSKEAPMYMPIL